MEPSYEKIKSKLNTFDKLYTEKNAKLDAKKNILGTIGSIALAASVMNLLGGGSAKFWGTGFVLFGFTGCLDVWYKKV